ncbi:MULTISPECIES: hypothetical protein [Planobispora]|uniref:Uncharacterized protein n=2 Tax=Planobispora TaxID=29298 RepID=A0A8J3T3J5_9ACTN|nr:MULTISPECIES: hypothetical protein [Planobispora]GIH96969.1 hypothetical protein Psi01_75990 [Planobispora siamensis]GII05417.1 hypothetical protein Pta02_74250 [Planobispora takensis]
MRVTKLPGGALRVPTTTTLADGVTLDGTRDIAPGDPEYASWLPLARSEEEQLRQEPAERASDREILARWRTRQSA